MNPYRQPMQPYPGLEAWSRYAQLSQLKMHFYDTGGTSKPALLLLHGLGDEADTWHSLLTALQDSYRIIAPDLPGFGRSQAARSGAPAASILAITELLDQLGISSVSLAGHSMGAMIAQAFALQYPQKVTRLALLGGSLAASKKRPSPGLLLFLIPALGEWLYTRLRKDPQAAYASLRPYYAELDSLPQAERDFLFQRVNERVWSDAQRAGYFAALRGLASWLPAQQKSLPARLAAFNCPTLLVWGEKDLVNPPADAAELISLQPNARLLVIPNAGHNLHQENPAAVMDALVSAWDHPGDAGAAHTPS